MAELGGVDAIWFAVNRGETHRIRPATGDEAAGFDIVKPGLDNLLTVVRRSDGAKVSLGFEPGDDIDRAMDDELTGWFDEDLDEAAERNQPTA
jgi:hypothetical protein